MDESEEGGGRKTGRDEVRTGRDEVHEDKEGYIRTVEPLKVDSLKSGPSLSRDNYMQQTGSQITHSH
jgi:hypothetical protein